MNECLANNVIRDLHVSHRPVNRSRGILGIVRSLEHSGGHASCRGILPRFDRHPVSSDGGTTFFSNERESPGNKLEFIWARSSAVVPWPGGPLHSLLDFYSDSAATRDSKDRRCLSRISFATFIEKTVRWFYSTDESGIVVKCGYDEERRKARFWKRSEASLLVIRFAE